MLLGTDVAVVGVVGVASLVTGDGEEGPGVSSVEIVVDSSLSVCCGCFLEGLQDEEDSCCCCCGCCSFLLLVAVEEDGGTVIGEGFGVEGLDVVLLLLLALLHVCMESLRNSDRRDTAMA